jgi:3-oxoisoapionate decarboxylase
MGLATTCFLSTRRFDNDTAGFLEFAARIGAGGIQAPLGGGNPANPGALRRRAEELGMYVEGMAALPRTADAAGRFEASLEAAGQAGALCLRVACGGRRYEDFKRIEDYRRFVSGSLEAIQRAVPLAERYGVTLAVENHKDFTSGELEAVLKRYSSERLRVCLDTGNNMALLEEPGEVVERLAPWAVSTHIKDMAVAECEDGFLLSEVPFGDGVIDLARAMAAVRQRARAGTRFTLEMITRDPLRIPCLSAGYWATFPDRPAAALARAMLDVRRRWGSPRPLPRMAGLAAEQRVALEEQNVVVCLKYAQDRLGL